MIESALLGDLNKIRWVEETEQVEQVILDSECDPIHLVYDGTLFQIKTKDISYVSIDFGTLERLNNFVEQAEILYNKNTEEYEEQD